MNVEKTLIYLYDELVSTSEQDSMHFDPIQYEDVGKYKSRIIKSGKLLELELFPVIPNKPSNIKKALSDKEKKEEKIRLIIARHAANLKYTKRNIIRIIHKNFKPGDLKATLKYNAENLPDCLEKAKKDTANYLRRMQRWATKKGWGKLRYHYVVSGGYPKERGEGLTRFHVHLTIGGFRNINKAKEIWGKCDYPHIEKIVGSIDNWANYVAKNAVKTNESIINGKESKVKRHGHSVGLIRSWRYAEQSEKKVSLKKIMEIQQEEYEIPRIFQQMFKSYSYTGHTISGSKFTKGKYIRITMMKKQNGRN